MKYIKKNYNGYGDTLAISVLRTENGQVIYLVQNDFLAPLTENGGQYSNKSETEFAEYVKDMEIVSQIVQNEN